jgi:hypothetical protein
MNYLFTINPGNEDVIVGKSPNGSTKVEMVAKVPKEENEALWHLVAALTEVSEAENIDEKLFEAIDNACQICFSNHKKK